MNIQTIVTTAQVAKVTKVQGKVFVGAAGGMGSTLGYCLSNISNYKNPQSFLKDFGVMAALDGTLSYLIIRLPIIGNLLIVGGMGIKAVNIWQMKNATKRRRLRNIGKFLLGSNAMFSTGLAGAVIGHLIIPVPILGAFVGGLVGGIIGGTGLNAMIKKI